MRKSFRNGDDEEYLACPVAPDWAEFHARTSEAVRQIDVMHRELKAQNLTAPLHDIAITLEEIKTDLLKPAIGRKQVPLSVCMILCSGLVVCLIIVLIADTKKNIEFGPIKIESKGEPAK